MSRSEERGDEMLRFTRMLIALATVGALALVWSTSALADNGTRSELKSFEVGAAVAGSKASARDVASGRITVLADNPVSGPVNVNSPKCFWTKPGEPWGNSFKNAHGQSVWYTETKPGKFCPSKVSPTGWVKVAGGKTGRNCKNPAKLGMKMPGKVVRGKVIFVKNFTAKIDLHAKARVAVWCEVSSNGTIAKAYAEAYGEARGRFSLQMFVKTKGKTGSKTYASAIGRATARAAAKAECTVVPVPPVPTPPVDVCPNLPGNQDSIPPGYVKDGAGNCVKPSSPPPTDVCPNLPGNQDSIPPGYVKDGAGNCVKPSPKDYTASGSTKVQDQKTLYQNCPAPNQNIQKSGSSDLKSLTSPVMTATSNVSQSDAQAKLEAMLAQWRTANQPIVDGLAQSEAQSRLDAALLTCPQPPPPSPVGCSAFAALQKDGRTVNLSVSVSGPVVSTSINWGDGTSSSGTSASHFYTADATFTITVTVTGDKGQTVTCSQTVTTKADSGPPPPP